MSFKLYRRDLLKSLLPVAFLPQLTINGKKTASEAAAIPPGHYLMFVDAMVCDIYELLGGPNVLPEGTTIHIIPLKLRPGQTIDDAVRIYELDNPGT